jgi:hypothetical protein
VIAGSCFEGPSRLNHSHAAQRTLTIAFDRDDGVSHQQRLVLLCQLYKGEIEQTGVLSLISRRLPAVGHLLFGEVDI